MKPLLLLITLWLLGGSLTAQLLFSDTFPGVQPGAHWAGDMDHFIVNPDGELQLQDTAGGSAWLSTWAPAADSAIWEGYLQLDFAPSSSNRLRLFVAASQAELDAAGLRGYFLQIGASGSDDRLELWRQDPDAATLLLAGAPGAVAAHPALRYRLTRSRTGEWTLQVDNSGAHDFQTEGSTLDTTYRRLEHFGLLCTYTSTRKDRFFFDDFLIAPLFQDTLPPQWLGLEPAGDNRLQLNFDEPLKPASANVPATYRIEGVEVLSAELGSPSCVTLTCAGLRSGIDYELQISGLQDLAGNVLPDQIRVFTYYLVRPPQPWELLIHEIYADPDTTLISNGLPHAEWVELYNRSPDALQLAGIQFADPGGSATLPDYVLPPDSLLLLCATENVKRLSALRPLLALEGFPSLNNSGDELRLLDSSGQLLHAVAYQRSWYGSNQKDDGGYSLEMIYPQQPCRGSDNWRASEAPLGATPGHPNSLHKPESDESGPRLMQAVPLTEQNLLLTFSEALQLAAAEDPGRYELGDLPIWAATLRPDRPEQVMLTLSQPLQPSFIYTLRVREAADCLGNRQAKEEIPVALPEPPAPGDVVLNEILFDPQVGGKDFLEFVNRSEKVLQISELTLSNGEQQAAISAPLLLFPGELFALSEEPEEVHSRYPCPNPERLFSNELPTFGPDTGTVLLLYAQFPDTQLLVIDSFHYNKDFHHPLLTERKGVSLERQRPDLPTPDSHNWQSAAENWGFATPTGRNSQFFESSLQDTSGFFQLEYPSFSPNGDGYRDVLRVYYRTERPGYVLQAAVYDAAGRPVTLLAQNEGLGGEGLVSWDGSTGRAKPAPAGVYVLLMEAFHPEGRVVRQRLSCVLSRSLR